jgi:DNA-directed RNA polymerase specialized sigma24 family protein
MAVSEQLLQQAQRRDPLALEAVIAVSYPPVYRMAHALSPDSRAAARTVERVMERSLRVLPTWRAGYIPENWFYHHTLLASRESQGGRIDPANDPLVIHSGSTDAGYRAFIGALRKLETQQAEAFILNHGEKLNSRLLGVAMDCSMKAADTHLRAATDSLSAIAGERINDYARLMEHAYAALSPPMPTVGLSVRQVVKRSLRRERLLRAARWLIVLIVLGAAALAIWHWREPVQSLIRRVRQ